MPLEFVRTKGLDKKFKLSMMYDGSGKRLSKTVWTMGEGVVSRVFRKNSLFQHQI